MRILAALFIDDIAVRQVAGPSTRLDIGGVKFSEAASGPLPVTVSPHLLVLVHCAPGDASNAALEVVFRRGDDELARNVQPLQVEPGKFNYRLVRAELELDEHGVIEAWCRIDLGPETVVPLTVLPAV